MSNQDPHAEGCMAGRQENKPKLKFMKHYRGDGTEPFEVENIEQIDLAIGQFAPEDQADLKKRFLAGEFTKEVPLKSAAAYIWTEAL